MFRQCLKKSVEFTPGSHDEVLNFLKNILTTEHSLLTTGKSTTLVILSEMRHIFTCPAMNDVAMLTQPDQSGWLSRSLFQQAWSA